MSDRIRRRELFVIPGGFILSAGLLLVDQVMAVGVFIGITSAWAYMEYVKRSLESYDGLTERDRVVVTSVLGVTAIILLATGFWLSSLNAFAQGLVLFGIACRSWYMRAS